MEWITIILLESDRMLRLRGPSRVKSSPKYAQNFIGTVGFPFFDKNKKMSHENNIPLIVVLHRLRLKNKENKRSVIVVNTQPNLCEPVVHRMTMTTDIESFAETVGVA